MQLGFLKEVRKGATDMQSTIRVLTVKQPWASAIFFAKGAKDVENRSWTQDYYRGPLIVHASKQPEGSHVDVLNQLGQRNQPLVDPDVLRSLPASAFPPGVILGHVTSPVYERENSSFGRYCVDIVFDYKIAPPLTKPEALENETLSKFAPFKWAMGTNFVIQDPAITTELDKVLEGRLARISPPCPEFSQQSLDAAIKQAKSETSHRVRKHIEQMDPAAFEWLVRALLLKLGYKNVNVHKQSADGGVDVRATLVAGGVANIQTCIQVKRQQTVGRPIVQNIRGSLSAHEAGLLVTSGHFTDEAREEANDPHKVPIALIDGLKLTELLLNLEIGVEHVNVTLYRLKLDDLSKEQLETRLEESDESES
jgi:restriction endonuclease Mrr